MASGPRVDHGVPTLLVIHGPPAAGKLTVARRVAERTGWALFHNHLTVDLLLALFDFGSPQFVEHRERIWLDLIGGAIGTGRSVVFTFNPERTVDPGFPGRLVARVAEMGGEVTWVALTCPDAVVEERVGSASRLGTGKLTSVAMYRQLRAEGAFDFPALPADVSVDTGELAPEEAARRITEQLQRRGKAGAGGAGG